ncbi:MAG: hypothetical protein PHH40_03270 [Candidatus Moranbacteria bacterium]|nr:hypothetical protein [Candidatus Moranbacteria bacterium]MDD3964731.1 hypothetical protein [Candidatus Moranbacteria bacterium]
MIMPHGIIRFSDSEGGNQKMTTVISVTANEIVVAENKSANGLATIKNRGNRFAYLLFGATHGRDSVSNLQLFHSGRWSNPLLPEDTVSFL